MKKTTFVALLLLTSQCWAETFSDSIRSLESEWAEIYYNVPKENQESAYAKLLEKSDTLGKKYPGKAEPMIWQAVIKSTNADNQDPVSALESIKEARDLLTKAITINPKALNGSAYVTLGTLYYMVPKWPVGFGDTEEAKKMLETALQINPDGIDSNYFYGDFLVSTDHTADALKYFERASQVPNRPNLSLADKKLKEAAQLAVDHAKQNKTGRAKNLFASIFQSSN